MGLVRLYGNALPWSPGGHPLERKKSAGPLTLLEFDEGFEDPGWCERGHAGYVLDGDFAFLLDEGEERFSAGDGFYLVPGTRHRARNAGRGVVRVFVYSWQG